MNIKYTNILLIILLFVYYIAYVWKITYYFYIGNFIKSIYFSIYFFTYCVYDVLEVKSK